MEHIWPDAVKIYKTSVNFPQSYFLIFRFLRLREGLNDGSWAQFTDERPPENPDDFPALIPPINMVKYLPTACAHCILIAPARTHQILCNTKRPGIQS